MDGERWDAAELELRQHEREQRRRNYRDAIGFSEVGAALDVAVMPELEEGAREAGVRLGNAVFQPSGERSAYGHN